MSAADIPRTGCESVAEALKGAAQLPTNERGDGTVPKAIRQVFIDTGAISGHLLKKYADALVKAEAAAVKRLTSARDAAKKAHDRNPTKQPGPRSKPRRKS